MGFYNKLHGEYESPNPFNVGDKVLWDGVTLEVGDDWEELQYWAGDNATKTNIVTTCGRVLSIDSVRKVEK